MSPNSLTPLSVPLTWPKRRGRPRIHPVRDTAFGCPRDFLNNRFVYLVVTPRVRGLLAGINLAPDKRCNFDCAYCEVDRRTPPREHCLDFKVMATELEATIQCVENGSVRQRPTFRHLPPEMGHIRHVALAGDGEPTLCPCLCQAIEAVVHVRARSPFPFFKLILCTNASLLEMDHVQASLRFFTQEDEIWVKLDAGTQAWMTAINRTSVPLEKVLNNILSLARQRPVVIQSLFPLYQGEPPSDDEIQAYAARLCELRDAGAQIALVQVCSATRPSPRSECSHLGLRALSQIAHDVRRATHLPVELF